MDRLTSYRPYLDPYEASAGTQLFQTRDAAAIMQAVLVRELGSAGYQPELASVRGRGGDELGIRYEVTRIRSTQGTPGMWPTPGFYRATVTTHVVVFRGDANCFMQSYFAYGEGTSVWSAFARAMDRSLGQSLPEVMNALSSCGTPAAETTE